MFDVVPIGLIFGVKRTYVDCWTNVNSLDIPSRNFISGQKVTALNRFQNSFTDKLGNKFAIMWLLQIHQFHLRDAFLLYLVKYCCQILNTNTTCIDASQVWLDRGICSGKCTASFASERTENRRISDEIYETWWLASYGVIICRRNQCYFSSDIIFILAFIQFVSRPNHFCF